MLIFDQLKRNDPHLRWLALAILYGLLVLLVGLWWVQVVSVRDYQSKLETQSFRTVRIPPVRGRILDRNGIALADSRPNYNVCLYVEDLRKAFDAAYSQELSRARSNLSAQMAGAEKMAGRHLTTRERKAFMLSFKDRNALRQQARYQVASNVVAQLGRSLQQPLALEESKFQRHYLADLALPLPVLVNVDATQIARFLEQAQMFDGLDLEMQPMRFYPYRTVAAHLLGQLKRDQSSAEGEDAFLDYPLPVFRGTVGIEAAFDQQLRGKAGAKSVLVNNLGYREGENIWTPPEPGQNVFLTIDLAIQQAAEKALQRTGPHPHGAVVVLDPNTGDVLALASSPAYNPNQFVEGWSREEWAQLNDPTLRPQINRATQENYAPGSIFKIVTGLACLEAGIDRTEKIYNPGHIYVGRSRHPMRDTAPPGEYNFHRGFLKSSNTYFITNGLRAGIQQIIRLGQRLHLGERTGLPTRQEVSGIFPTPRRVSANWYDGDTANVCIGQGPIAVTPLQMALMTATIANGGKVLWPRLVERIEPQDMTLAEQPTVFPQRVRGELGVKPRNLEILRDAMLADVEDPEGTGFAAFHERDRATPALKGLRVCGKTGTAQVMNERNQVVDYTAWFVSFAPYEKPRYVVVVMVEGGGSGGGTCGPVARDIYLAIQQREKASPAARKTLAQVN